MELGGRSDRPEPTPARVDNRSAEMMRGQLLDGRSHADDLIRRYPVRGLDALHDRMAEREGPRLVEHDGLRPAQLLDRRTGLDDDAKVSGTRDPCDDGHGRRED